MLKIMQCKKINISIQKILSLNSTTPTNKQRNSPPTTGKENTNKKHQNSEAKNGIFFERSNLPLEFQLTFFSRKGPGIKINKKEGSKKVTKAIVPCMTAINC